VHRADTTRELDSRGIFREVTLKKYNKNDIFVIEFYDNNDKIEIKDLGD
jgi:hypothetical protein